MALGMLLPAVPALGQVLDPGDIPKYVDPLVIPPAMPRSGKIKVRGGKNIDYYEIAVRQFTQQILPTGLPATTVWSYGSVNHPGTFNFPAFTIEAKCNTGVRVKWINDLKDPVTGNFLPHLLPVDPTLHWANPPGGQLGRDMRPIFTATPEPYTGPVPIVTHVHGAHTTEDSDGYPEAWYLPAASNIPSGYATTGTYYDKFKTTSPLGGVWGDGFTVMDYPNTQKASTLWYHDHTLGMTRVNVYAGPAGFYLLRGGPSDAVTGVLPGPAPAQGDPPGMSYYEIPIAIQDRMFKTDGSLYYPDTREFFDGIAGPYLPETDVSPIWNPEFFGNTMVVNGRTWPYLNVEPRRYRFRFLNGCNSRFLVLRTDNAGVDFWQIGAEGGFLPAPVPLSKLLMGPAERADVIMDFTGLAPGTTVTLLNIGPDEPFGGEPCPPSDPNSTGQVMQFKVVPLTAPDPSTPPAQLVLPARAPLGVVTNTRQVSLNEMMSMYFDGPAEAVLGTIESGMPVLKMWHDPITENPAVGATEIWEIFNFTEDAHPIHIHQTMFEVIDREPILGLPVPRPPELWETGLKDTVIAYPGEITRVKAVFDIPGLFVWHCHIIEHEDNEMMRPMRVGPPPP
ncbi:MAG: multicopper oxidase family protein [Armatimonadota bacterium]